MTQRVTIQEYFKVVFNSLVELLKFSLHNYCLFLVKFIPLIGLFLFYGFFVCFFIFAIVNDSLFLIYLCNNFVYLFGFTSFTEFILFLKIFLVLYNLQITLFSPYPFHIYSLLWDRSSEATFKIVARREVAGLNQEHTTPNLRVVTSRPTLAVALT